MMIMAMVRQATGAQRPVNAVLPLQYNTTTHMYIHMCDCVLQTCVCVCSANTQTVHNTHVFCVLSLQDATLTDMCDGPGMNGLDAPLKLHSGLVSGPN